MNGLKETDMKVFGLGSPYICDPRDYLRHIQHPGANNCACAKLDGGLSCVPPHMLDAWYAYIGLSTEKGQAA